jgi:hypothetical protein
MSSSLAQLRVETTVAELRAIESAVRAEFGDIDQSMHRAHVAAAVHIYCAKLIQEAQK